MRRVWNQVVILLLLPAVTHCGGLLGGTEHQLGNGPVDASSQSNASSAIEPTDAAAQDCYPITFGDPSVELSVRNAISVSQGAVSEPDVAAITKLELSNVHSLQGLQCLKGLRSVSLSSSQPSSLLPLSASKQLTNLEMVDCEAPFQEIGELSSLTRLRLEGRGVTSIEFVSRLTKLTDLTLANTSVSDLGPLSGLDSLYSVAAIDSPVEDVSALANHPHLSMVHLEGSNVKTLAPLDKKPPAAASCAEVYVTRTSLDSVTLSETIPHMCSMGWMVIWQGTLGSPGALGCGVACPLA